MYNGKRKRQKAPFYAFLFFIYMISNYALRAFDMVIFAMPLWLWLIVQIVLLVGSYYYIKKEDLI